MKEKLAALKRLEAQTTTAKTTAKTLADAVANQKYVKKSN
jgi:hypothetical protein